MSINVWEGETLALKVMLIKATANRRILTAGDATCPVVSNANDVCETMNWWTKRREGQTRFQGHRNVIGGR
ncbi:hypothetical protein BDY19DRAFT_964739 [Irpex rosettiformis]|uniref:Uncharacterized protein n=1 Tax=Irpex rosettiformis TaxID=378272 RepID=A0ACB8TV92_9APHY|nr:hypothetical protein BDY19DRAFT_964739 [Irpex rosettiformis]